MWSWRAVLAMVVLVLAVWIGYHHVRRSTQPQKLLGYVLTPPRPVPPVVLQDSAGAPVTFSTVGNRGAALVYFGYSQCPDACPVTLAGWQKVKRLLGDDARRVRFVFVTVDPAHDTPRVLQSYLDHFDPAFVGLTGTKGALDSAQSAVYVDSIENNPMSADSHIRGYTHAVAVSVIDSLGRLRAAIPVHATPRAAATDLERLLHGGG